MLPTILSISHGRRFLDSSVLTLNPSDLNKNHLIVNEFNDNLKKAVSIDASLLRTNGYQKVTLDQTSSVVVRRAFVRPKFYLFTPFPVFFESDAFVLVFAFFASFSGIFFYFYYNVFFEKQEKADYLTKINLLKKQVSLHNLPPLKRLFK